MITEIESWPSWSRLMINTGLPYLFEIGLQQLRATTLARRTIVYLIEVTRNNNKTSEVIVHYTYKFFFNLNFVINCNTM